MDYSFFIILLILIIIGMTVVFTLVLCAINSIHVLASRSSDLLTYYIYNMRYSIFFASAYISFFILFLYGLRLWNTNHPLDLRIGFNKILEFFQLPLSFWLPALVFGFFIGINLLLCIIRLQKYCLHHIFILYIYLHYSEGTPYGIKLFFRKISMPFALDFIAWSIDHTLFSINAYLLKDREFNGVAWYSSRVKIPWYFLLYHLYSFVGKLIYNKYYAYLVKFSPILVILYDCLFHNFVISHVYTYLLIYIPVMLWRRITICLSTDASYICELLCNIYYKKETCLYAIRAEHKIILDSYIESGLRSDVNLFLDGIDLERYLKSASRFVPDNDELKGYRNSEGLFLERKLDNSLISENTDDTIEEWILIVDKHHFVNHNKYKTLVFIN